jgi:glutamine synthetase
MACVSDEIERSGENVFAAAKDVPAAGGLPEGPTQPQAAAHDRRQIQFAELDSWLNDHRVTEIECLVPDLTGVARGKILPREKFTEDRGMRLPEVVVAMSVTGEYPREGPYFDVVSRNDADMHLVADPSTVRIVPWAADPTAQVIHDCYDRHGALVRFAPRSVLRRVCELFDRKGWTPVVAPELEFYLVARNTDADLPLKAPIGRSGRAETSRQAYSIDAVNEFDPLFEDVYEYCEKMELNVDTLIHEVGAGQMEINFFHSAPLDLADEVFLFKRIVREAALRHDMYATFMAKPIAGEPGSAMHVHQSLVSKETGRNLFSNEDGTPSQEFFWYIGGLQKYIPAAMALFAPYVNSYRRLARFTAAPINIQWGIDNRTVGIRSPVSTPHARRVENRVIGADANPYVALAATLACGYLGIEQRIEPTAECTGDGYQSAHELPRSLAEAVSLLRADHDLADVLGKEFVTVYTEIKDLEHEEFMRVISPWEREHLLLHV